MSSFGDMGVAPVSITNRSAPALPGGACLALGGLAHSQDAWGWRICRLGLTLLAVMAFLSRGPIHTNEGELGEEQLNPL